MRRGRATDEVSRGGETGTPQGRQQLRREDCGKRDVGGGAETAPDRESGKGR